MKIIYNINPLCTRIELDDHDLQVLRLKLIIESMRETIIDVGFSLVEGDKFDLAHAREELDLKYWCGNKLNTEIEELFQYSVNSLLGWHAGDCICMPASCTKCHVEDLLDISTIPGLSKHPAHFIDVAFKNETNKSITDVIAYLKEYKAIKGEGWEQHSQADFDKYVPNWITQAKIASQWMEQYQKEHFSNDKSA